MLILNTNVPENKAAFLALQEIYGVGIRSAIAICNLVDISPQIQLKSLTTSQLDLLVKSCRRLIPDNKIKDNIFARKSLVSINSYRGTRHIQTLPCQGQRTRTNALTSKTLLARFKTRLH
jgi:small subunit ribosomal protein S13